ncbi:Transcription factor e2f8 [Mactra antiquata]
MSQVDNLIPEHIKSSLGEAEIDSEGEINMDPVPFAKNTIKMDFKQIDKSLKAMSAQNKENMKACEADENQNRQSTPTNEIEAPGQPLTPTANLKVLFNAMSPELRHRDELKQSTSEDDVSLMSSQDYQFETIIDVNAQEIDPKYGPSRKEKSLGLLCQRFLHRYPEHPKPGEKYEICLDAVAKELDVERRRIYDIINVLESVEIVSRVAKNRYAWHGKNNLCMTLAKLKALGDSEGFGEQIQRLKDYEFNRELEEQFGRTDPRHKCLPEPDFSIFGENSLFNQAALRKDKSLGIMSQKFLMLFLVSKPKTVNLDLSAKLLIGDANIDRTENSKFKTKIRRLYDIANILTSLGLICKVHVTEIRGRKPAFRYIGPDIDDQKDLQLACCSDGCHRPSSRHSMLDCIRNQRVAKIMDSFKTIKPGDAVKTIKPVTAASSSDEEDGKLRFSRHSSFETLCAVATVETNKMYASEPNSPVKNEDASTSKSKDSMKNDSMSADELLGKLPTKGFVKRKVLMKRDDAGRLKQNNQNAEAIIIKAAKPIGKAKHSTVIPLTKEQIDAVLRSLKVPVPVGKGTEVVENTVVSTNIGDSENCCNGKDTAEMQVVNENTPVITVNTPEKASKRPVGGTDVIPPEKRVRLDFQSPCSEDDRSPVLVNHSNIVSRFKKTVSDAVRPSPQRALHLAPEFAQPVGKMTPEGDAATTDNGLNETNEEVKPNRIEIIFNENMSQSKNVVSASTISPKSVNNSVVVTQANAQFGTLLNHQGQNIVQLVSHASTPTILHLPIVNFQGQGQQKIGQPQALPVTVQPNVQIVQAGQQLVQLPITMNPNSSPGNGSNSPRVITYTIPNAQSNISVANIQLVPQSNATTGSPVNSLIRPIATKVTASPGAGSQIVASQFLDKSSLTYVNNLGKTQGGFIPIANANGPKIIVTSNPTTEVRSAGSVAVDSS